MAVSGKAVPSMLPAAPDAIAAAPEVEAWVADVVIELQRLQDEIARAEARGIERAVGQAVRSMQVAKRNADAEAAAIVAAARREAEQIVRAARQEATEILRTIERELDGPPG